MTTETIRAHNDSIQRTGPWTTARRFDVRASSSSVVLDLLLPEISDGEIEIAVDLSRSTLKLLVPDGAIVDADDLRRVGRGRVKDWTGTAAADGRRIRIVGEMRDSELRITAAASPSCRRCSRARAASTSARPIARAGAKRRHPPRKP